MNKSRPAIETRCKDVLILTAPTGGGHDSVAVALQEALHALAPDVGVRILDPLSGGMSIGPLSPGRCYDAMVAHVPRLWGLCYHATNNPRAVRVVEDACARLWGRRLRSSIEADRPALVVSVHPLCTRLAAGILRTSPAAPPLHCVVTDLVTIHRCWACAGVDAFYVATSEARDALVAMGIPRERLQVTGLPLRASFAQAPQVPVAGTPRVLLLGGGRPSRRVEGIARALVSSHLPLQLIVVCGRNARLRRRLTQSVGARATVLGWRDDVAALMRWSSVVVTKGGPTTVAETLSQARPVLISHALPGQECGNVTLVERTGAGSYMPDEQALARAVASCPPAWPADDAARAVWWGSAARRVAHRLVAAHVDRAAVWPAGLRSQPHGSATPAAAGSDASSQRLPAHAALAIDSGHDPAEIPGTRTTLGVDCLPPGKVIHNPISGERIIIRESGAQTGGRLLSFDLFLPPGAHVPARHAHPAQEERFTVVAGQMRFRLGHRRRAILANPGDTIPIPAGTAHWFGNAGAGVAHARVEVRPALRMEELFESAATMGVARYFPGAQMPRLSDLALFLREFQRELAVPDVPASLVRAFLAPFARLGRRHARAAGSGAAK